MKAYDGEFMKALRANAERMRSNLKFKTPTPKTSKKIRHENKALIDPCTADRFASLCERYIEHDKFCDQSGSYFINSLYLDTPFAKDYAEKEFGAYDRKKMRIRNYGYELDWANLEMKRKIDVWEYKDSVRLTKEQVYSVAHGDFSPLLDIGTAKSVKMYAILTEGVYRPSNIVEYDREAFVLPFEDVRITFDRDVRFTISEFDLFKPKVTTPVFPDGYVVLEIKYNEYLPGWAKKILNEINHSSESVSKYCAAKEIIM